MVQPSGNKAAQAPKNKNTPSEALKKQEEEKKKQEKKREKK